MQTRRLGGVLEVGAMGLGCMGMTHGYVRPEEVDEPESIATIHRALDRGVTLLDTAEVYGPFTNEVLVGKALRGRRERVVVATKFGLHGGADGSPANARRVAEASLRRLEVEVLDLFYLHRKDPKVPIEESVGGMKRLVEDGLVRFLGLSEVGPETLRRAHAVHPITALQSEYSVFERGVEKQVLPTCRELGIGLVPFSPLGRGFLAGAFKDDRELAAGDFLVIPRGTERSSAGPCSARSGVDEPCRPRYNVSHGCHSDGPRQGRREGEGSGREGPVRDGVVGL